MDKLENFYALTVRIILLPLTLIFALPACTQQAPTVLITIADARNHPAQIIDNGEPGDSLGDILVFDQPLLDKDMNPVGNNNGSCIRTRVGHSFQCQWTLTTENGSILVAGKEYDAGTSSINIIGGTGNYQGINGVMESTNNNDGTFTQVLRYSISN